jgi:hypothetical protein
MESDVAEVQLRANIDAFIFNGDLPDDHPAIDLARQYARTRDPSLLSQLAHEGSLVERHEKHNLIVTVGRAVLANLLAGITTYSGAVNYGALGSSSTAVANTDTQLGTEVYRKLFASRSTDGNNVAYIDFLYAAADTNGTYQEFGNFIDGTASANTGQMFSHILTGGWTKTSAQTLFISCQYTLS